MSKIPTVVVCGALSLSGFGAETKVKVEGEGEGGGQRNVIRFRGFRGRCRLSWTGADGKPVSKFVELK